MILSPAVGGIQIQNTYAHAHAHTHTHTHTHTHRGFKLSSLIFRHTHTDTHRRAGHDIFQFDDVRTIGQTGWFGLVINCDY